MASTTSTDQAGLLGHLLSELKKSTGIDVKVVGVCPGSDPAEGKGKDIVGALKKSAQPTPALRRAATKACHPKTKALEAQEFADWAVLPVGQGIKAARKFNGEQLFFPDAER